MKLSVSVPYLLLVSPGRCIASLLRTPSAIHPTSRFHSGCHPGGIRIPPDHKNKALASVYPLSLVHEKSEKASHRRYSEAHPLSAQPPRDPRHIKRRAILRTTTTTTTNITTVTTGRATQPLSALDGLLGLVLDLLDLVGEALLAGAPGQDAGDLDDADDAEEEVDGGEQVVLGLDDEAPARPDEAGGGQGSVLLQRELLGRAAEVGYAGEDESPLHKREMKS